MIVLHLGIIGGRMYVWGEVPGESGKLGRRRGRAPRGVPPRSPFDAPPERLREALQMLGVEFRGGESASRNLVAWLPSIPEGPVASSLLISGSAGSGADAEIKPWTVSALEMTVLEAQDLLVAASVISAPVRGVVVGSDIGYWIQAFRVAVSLAARGRFLPGIKPEGSRFFAVWDPVFADEDLRNLNCLAGGLPGACFCLTADAVPPQNGAKAAVHEFIRVMLDAMARRQAAVLHQSSEKSGRRKKTNEDGARLHDQWLKSLASPDGCLEVAPHEAERLAWQVNEWRRKIDTLATAPFRLCFRLEEPDAGDDNESSSERTSAARTRKTRKGDEQWRVSYLLQARDDLSLLVPVAQVWGSRRGKTKLSRGIDWGAATEFLLAALGQAAGLSPRIEASLRNPAPSGFSLNSSEAYEFLTVQAPLLSQAGFGVMLPSWWQERDVTARLAVRGKIKSPAFTSGSRLGLEQVIAFEWEAALGDEVISRQELEELARLKSPLVKLRGRWVEADPVKLKEAVEFWRRMEEKELTVGDAVRLALGAVNSPQSLPLAGLNASGWVGEVLARLQGDEPYEEIEPPPGLRGKLRPYQIRGYAWLEFLSRLGLGACLADDMGLGKTVQTLALIQRRYEEGMRRPVLLVCPTSVIANWEKEAARFTPDLAVLVHHGPERKRGSRFTKAAGSHAMVVTSYALLAREGDLFQQVEWDGVILDEAQNIKNPETRQARAARALPAGFRIALTGTPVENNVGDLWSLMEFLNPGLLGSQARFKRTFLVPVQVNRDPEATQALKRLTGPFILRRLKTDRNVISDLPDKMEVKVFCPLTREQASLYAAVVREIEEALDRADGIERKGLILAALSKLKQICNHPAHFLKDNSDLPDRSGKLIRLTEMAEEILAEGEKALIFTQFAEMGALLQKYLVETFGRPVLFLHGGVPKKERDRMVELFQSERMVPFFILTLKAGGTGLNLTGANHVFHFDRWWNPAVENQATDRAFRIGQTQKVQVYKFICQGTIEEKIDELIEGKLELAQRLVGSGEDWLTELSTRELKELMALRSGAVIE
ncbi:MAG: DEAD/DEAH box helicase [Syntrophothermus sp.]|uniref:DEAD/DEAH box helicase n=1 Tax=Syntrophothermus sp. TaxID=2736299 RepID=UPI00257A70DD|nr:DEAD/DEAH box helicase [Syntrophothermus sp.]NSW81680.1 DEAD/DEAH box helicase [Syntrophothermus sp.]